MFEIFKRNHQVSKSNKEYLDIFVSDFFSNDNHSWIAKDRYIRANFEEFFEKLPSKVIKKFVKGPGLIFIPSSGKYSCTLSNLQCHIIIVFPELMRLLRSSATNHALAILAHEVGHIIYDHSKKVMDPIEAQVEADMFACQLGFGNEIESFLEDQPESLEKRVRITYVTAHLTTQV